MFLEEDSRGDAGTAVRMAVTTDREWDDSEATDDGHRWPRFVSGASSRGEASYFVSTMIEPQPWRPPALPVGWP